MSSVSIIGDFITHKKGFAFKSQWYVPNGHLVVRVSDTTSDSIDVTKCNKIGHELAGQFLDYMLRVDDIVIMTVGSWPSNPASVVGKVIRVPEEADGALLNQNAVRIRSNGKIDQEFLYYLLKNKDFSSHLISVAQGSANQASVTLEDIYSYEAYIPPLPEQEAIAEVLSSLDDKIDLLHSNNKTLEQLAETLFRQWFIEEADDSWEEVSLGSIVETELGGTPSTTNPEYWNGSIPWINSGEVNNYRIFKPTKYITELGLRKSNTKLLPKKSTVIAITGATMGQVSYLEIDSCANQSVVGVIPNEIYYPEYIHLLVRHHVYDMLQNETGGAQPHINKNDVKSVLIRKPNNEKLCSHRKSLELIYDKISINCFSIDFLQKLRDTLLPKLMSGEVRVQDIKTTIPA